MERFAVKYFAQHSILEVWGSSEYASELDLPNDANISKIKEPRGVNTSVFVKEFDLSSLKSDVDK